MSIVYANAASKSNQVKSESAMAANRFDSAAFQMGWAMSDEAYEKEKAADFQFLGGQVLDQYEYPPLGSLTARTGPSTSLAALVKPAQVLSAASSTTSAEAASSFEEPWTPPSSPKAYPDTHFSKVFTICQDDPKCLQELADFYMGESQNETNLAASEEAFQLGLELLEMIQNAKKA
jgi:hypothetical protein